MTTVEVLLTVAIVALVTLFTRAAAFLIFRKGKPVPLFIIWLGKQLPRAVMMMLVVYCLKDVSFASSVQWVPALAGVVITAAMHLWRRQMILSIVSGTAVYMLLIRLIQ